MPDAPDGPFFDRRGREVDWERFLELHIDPTYAVVMRTEVGRSTVVTSWVGMDPEGREPPRIFVTDVFPDHPSNLELPDWAYPTEREARRGHGQACRLARAYQDGS